jgi:hypothetical protein
LEFRLAYIADTEATFTPAFKLMLDNEATFFQPGDDRVASLFLWHFVEEVEHRLFIFSAELAVIAVVALPTLLRQWHNEHPSPNRLSAYSVRCIWLSLRRYGSARCPTTSAPRTEPRLTERRSGPWRTPRCAS